MAHNVIVTSLTFLALLSSSYMLQINIYANLEQLYTVEDDLLLIYDVTLREERNNQESVDIQGLFNITSFVEEVKGIHKDVGMHLEVYLAHPINVYHLLKRLVREWEGIIPQLKVRELFTKGFRKKLEAIKKILPTEEDMSKVAEAIVRIQDIIRIPSDELRRGIILGRESHEPLTLEDWFEIARAAFEIEEYFYAATWLKEITSECQSVQNNTSQDLTFNATNTLSLLATTYYKMGRVPDAVRTLDMLLKLDPSNNNARRNKQYFSEKSNNNTEIGELARQPPQTKHLRQFEELCKGEKLKTPTELSRLRCLYFPERDTISTFPLSKVKAEVVNRKPLIIIFRGFTRNATTSAMQSLAYYQIHETIEGYSLWLPRGMILNDHTNRRWVSKEQERIHNLHLSNFPTAKGMKYQVFVFGMEGLSEQHQILPPSWKNMAGTFLTFLSGVRRSGEIVFPKLRTSVPVTRGDSIFFEEGADMRVCPIAQGSIYVGVQEILELVPDRMTKRKRSIYHSLVKKYM